MLSGFNREAKQSKQILRRFFLLLLLEHFQMHIKVVLESCMKQSTCLDQICCLADQQEQLMMNDDTLGSQVYRL